MGFKMIEIPHPKLPMAPVTLDKKINYATATNGEDTVFLMTDGKPNAGRIDAPEDILAELKKVNRLRKVTVHTICVGDVPPGGATQDSPDPVFLKKIADQNKVTPGQVMQYLEQNNQLSDLRLALMERKVRDFLRENARIVDRKGA